MILLFSSYLLKTVVPILLLNWGAKKLFRNSRRGYRVISICLIAFGVFFITDLILARQHIAPIFAMPIFGAGDGGSMYFIGPFYHVFKAVAFKLGRGDPLLFEYYIASWGFKVMYWAQ